MNKILKILSIPFIFTLSITIYVFYLINHNQNYLDSITKNIKDNYKINEKITYSNEYNNYYILTTKNRVIVLNNEYTEILNENINSIKTIPQKQKLIYKNNKLMFEKTIIKKDNIIYKYYDATNGEFIKETVLEQK